MLYALDRYLRVSEWTPANYLDDTPQWELDLMWLVHEGKLAAQQEVRDEEEAAMKRATKG